MTSIVLVLALMQNPVALTRPSPGSPDPQMDGPITEANPDVVTRGTSTTIVVTGNSAEELKTLQIDPPDGIRLSGMRPLPARGNGLSAMEVVVTVDRAAAPGMRSLVMTTAPIFGVSSTTRPGADPATRQIEQAFQEIIKRETKPAEVGTLFVNAHDVKITQVRVAGSRVTITVVDPMGDIVLEPSGAAVIPIGSAGTAPIELHAVSGPIESEVRCGGQIADSFVLPTGPLTNRDASGAVQLSGELDLSELQGVCDLRVRVVDKDGNVSLWYSTKVQGRR